MVNFREKGIDSQMNQFPGFSAWEERENDVAHGDAGEQAARDLDHGMAHPFAQPFVVRGILGETVDRGCLAADVLAQAVGIDDDDEAQSNGDAEGWVADTLAQGNQGRHARHYGAVIRRETAISDQVERPFAGFDTVNQEFDRTDSNPGQKRRHKVSEIHL